MKTIGLLGGMSWESSLEYYRIVNELVKERLGGLHSADCLMYSVDFAEIERLQHSDDWPELTRIMIDAGHRLERGGAECLVICTNTMHKMAPEMEAALSIPLIHIADAAGEAIAKQGLTTVALLGTKFTMQGAFYRERLAKKFGLTVMIPDGENQELVHHIIYNELVKGIFSDHSRKIYQQVIADLQQNGAQGVILGCTEIPLLIKEADSPIPVFDTTRLHAEAAVTWALAD